MLFDFGWRSGSPLRLSGLFSVLALAAEGDCRAHKEFSAVCEAGVVEGTDSTAGTGCGKTHVGTAALGCPVVKTPLERERIRLKPYPS
jgi:hypothetical protein